MQKEKLSKKDFEEQKHRQERKKGENQKRGERKKCRMCYEERETIEHVWNECSEMRERERKERGEKLNEDGREIGWMKEMWKKRDRIEKERGENVIIFFFGIGINHNKEQNL
jgi:hypothetical protein